MTNHPKPSEPHSKSLIYTGLAKCQDALTRGSRASRSPLVAALSLTAAERDSEATGGREAKGKEGGGGGRRGRGEERCQCGQLSRASITSETQ